MKKLIASALAAAALLASGPATAQAGSSPWIVTYYYSDISMTNLVGIHWQYCDWSQQASGQITIHSRQEVYECP